jgi:peptidyl-prolyl cis-trans isomerase C
MRKSVVSASLILGLALAGPLAAAEDQAAADKVLVEVNGTPITQASIDAYAEQRQQVRPGAVAPDQLLNEVVGKELVYQDAEKTGLTKDPAVVAQVERLRRELIVGEALDAYSKAHPATEEEIKAVYDTAVKEAAGEEFKARHILVESEDDAKAIIVELDGGGDFVELAKSKSTGPSGKQGGDLGWFRAETMVKPFSEAASKLDKGQYTKAPVKTQFGWHVILLEDIRPIEPPPLDAVRPQIEKQLQQVKLQQYVEGLRAKATIAKP